MAVSITKTPSFGLSPFHSGGRKTTSSYEGNETPSYVPTCLLKGGEENLKLPTHRILSLSRVSLAGVQGLKTDIKNHVEMRLQLFFHQLLLSYKSGLEYSYRFTDRQVGSGNIDYAAAHSSTLPSLSSAQDGTEVAFCKGSGFYDAQNATVLLPKVVNDIDSRIDRHNGKLGVKVALRESSIEILNQVAQLDGEMDPKKGWELFIREFLFLVGRATHLRSARIKEASKAPEIARLQQELFILKCYREVADSYLSHLANDEAFIERLCFRPSKGKIGHEYYARVQATMHRKLSAEVSKASPAKAEPQKPVVDPSDTQRELRKRQMVEEVAKTLAALTGKGVAYLGVCSTSDKVKQMVAEYFAQMDEATLKKDLETLPKIKTFATRHKQPLSQAMINVWKEARAAIQEAFKVADPRNMGSLLLHLLSF